MSNSVKERTDYEEVETLRDADGVIAVITRRIKTGNLSFRIQKEFKSQGKIKASAYLGAHHIPAIERLVRRVKDRINILTDAGQGYLG